MSILLANPLTAIVGLCLLAAAWYACVTRPWLLVVLAVLTLLGLAEGGSHSNVCFVDECG